MSVNDTDPKLNPQTDNSQATKRTSGLVSISGAAKFLSVSQDTLRNWEAQGKLIPQRTEGGARRYTPEQLYAYKKLLNPLPQAPIGVLSVSKAAEELKVSADTIRNWENKGLIKAERTEGGSRRFSRTEIKRLQNELNIKPNTNISTEPADTSSSITLDSDKQVINPSALAPASVPQNEVLAPVAFSSNEPPVNPTPPPITRKPYFFSLRTFVLATLFLLTLTGAVLTVWLIGKDKQTTILEHLNISDNKILTMDTGPLLQINKDIEINGTASISGALSVPTINTGFGDNEVYPMDQPLLTTSEVTFGGLNLATLILTAPSNQLTLGNTVISTQQGGSGAFTVSIPSITANDTFVLTNVTQTLTNKTMSGSENTFTNIPNSALSSSKITINTGSGLTGGGDVSLGESITISATGGSSSGVTSITGTANQVTASASTGDVTLSLPQEIAVTSTPSFAGLNLNGSTSGTVTVEAAAVTTDFTLTLPNDGGTSGYVLSTDGAGNTSWVPGGGGGTIGGSGTANTITKFTAATTIGNSLLTDDGITFAVNTNMFTVDQATGDTAIAGTLGVTGAVTGSAFNGLTITPTTGTLTIANAKTSTVSNSLTFTGTDGTSFAFPSISGTVCTTTTCFTTGSTLFNTAGDAGTGSIIGGDTFAINGTAAQGISTSLSGDTFTVTVANAAADGSTKGVAAFNATNFSAASGVINTIQNINSTASPTFLGLTVSGLSINSAVYTDGSSSLTTTAPTSGTIGYWNRTGTTLSPATANDVVSVASSNTTGADVAVTNSGVYTGTGVLNVSANSATTGRVAALSGTGLTTGTGLTITGGTAFTTGGLLQLTGASYNHTTTETGFVSRISFTDASTLNAGSSATNGLSIAGTINSTSSGAKGVTAYNAEDPTWTACTGGACTYNAFRGFISHSGGSAMTAVGANIQASGVAGGNLVGVNISSITPGNGTEVGVLLSPGWDFGYYYGASAAYTQTAAMNGGTFDLSTAITVPNSAAGNQTGLAFIMKDGGASATSVALSISGTYDTGISIAGTPGTNILDSGSLDITAAGAITGATGITSSGTITFSGLGTNSAVYTNGSSQLTTTAPTSGAIGYWTRTGTTLSPTASGDNVTTSGNISTSGTGTITSAGILTASGDLSVTGTSTLSGDIAFNASTPTIVISGGETLSVTDGSNTLLSLADAGATGNLTITGTINTNTLTSTALTFSGADPVISASTPATSISLNPGAGGIVNFAGGSGSTGCSIDDTTGDFSCAGDIVGGGGDQGFWSRAATTLSPTNTGDNVTTTGNISTTGTGTITSAGLLTAQNGLTLTTGNISLTSTSGTAALTLTSSTTAFNVNSGLFNIDTSNSRVGIGTTTPNAKMDILSTTSPQLRVSYDTSNFTTLGVSSSGVATQAIKNGQSLVITDGSNTLCTITDNGSVGDFSCTGSIGGIGSVGFWSRSGTDTYLTNTGDNVGIGTATPFNKLHILTTENLSSSGLTIENTSTGTGAGAGIQLNNDSINAQIYLTSSAYSLSGGSNALVVRNAGDNPIEFFTNTSERMRIQGDGNVGIGTNSPGAKLHVDSDIAAIDGVYYQTLINGEIDGSQIFCGGNCINVYSLYVNPSYTSGSGNTIDRLTAAYLLPSNSSSGTITTMTGLEIRPNNGTGTIGTVYGAYIGAPLNNGTITNKYALVTESGAGNVGIDDESPASLFTVGSGDLFQINTTGQIGAQTAPASDYLFTGAGSTANDYSRIFSISQANNAAEDSFGIHLANTVAPGSLTSGTRNVRNLYLSFAPTSTSTNAINNTYGIDQAISLSNITLGNSDSADSQQNIYGSNISITGTPVIANADGSFTGADLDVYGIRSVLSLTPNTTSVSDAGTESVAGYFSSTVVPSGSVGANHSARGIEVISAGNLGTSGTTRHYGALIDVSGTSDLNYGLHVTVGGATTNYAGIFSGGNVGIGDLTPDALLDIDGSTNITDLGITHTFNPSAGGTYYGIENRITNAPTSTPATTYGQYNLLQDSTALANALHGVRSEVVLSGDAAKIGFGVWGSVSSNSNTADSLRGGHFEVTTSGNAARTSYGSFSQANGSGVANGLTMMGGHFGTSLTGVMTTGLNHTTYGVNSSPASTGAHTGGTLRVHGVRTNPSATAWGPGANSLTSEVIGFYAVGVTNQAASASCASCVAITYGARIDNAATNTNGTSTQYGLFIDSQSGSDTNYQFYSAGTANSYFAGNVGIGTLGPSYKLDIKPSSASALRLQRASGGVDTDLVFSNESPTDIWSIHLNGSSPEQLMIYPTAANYDLVFQANEAGTRFGNVGIGDITPDANLDVDGSAAAPGQTIAMIGATGNMGNSGRGIGALDVNLSFNPSAGGESAGISNVITVAPTNTAINAFGNYTSLSDNTTLANTLISSYTTMSITNNAGHAGYGTWSDITSSSTTGEVLNAGRFNVDKNGASTTSASTLIAVDGIVTNDGISDTNAATIYGGRFTATGNTGGTNATVYGIWASASGGDTGFNYPFYSGVAFPTGNAERLCWDAVTESAIYDCTGTPGDYAEEYGTSDTSLGAGDIVVADPNRAAIEVFKDGEEGSKAWVIKSSSSYQSSIIGIVSTNPNETIGENFTNEENPRPIALNGRVPLKVSSQNGEIKPGDYITSSSIPGIGMKATRPGQMVGKALEGYSGGGIGKVMVFVNIAYADPTDALANLLVGNNGQLLTSNPTHEKITISSDVKVNGLVSASDFALDATLLNRTGSLAAVPVNSEGKVSLADTVNSLNSRITQTSQVLGEVKSDIASQSASLAQVEQLSNRAIEHSQSLDEKVASTSANLSSLSSRIDELLSSISGEDNEATASPDLTPPSELIAIDSATFANLNVTDTLSTFRIENSTFQTLDAKISGTLKSLGDTFLGRTTIAGDFSVDGTLSLTGNSINSIGCSNATMQQCNNGILYLQNTPLAQGVDFFNGLVMINKDGTFTAQTVIASEYKTTSGKISGSGIIRAGQKSAEIITPAVESSSRILITPNITINSPLAVTSKVPGQKFIVANTDTVTTDISFDWFLINEKSE